MSKSILMIFSMLQQPVGLLKLTLNVFCANHFQGRELYVCYFIGLHRGTCEPIHFKFGMMLDMANSTV